MHPPATLLMYQAAAASVGMATHLTSDATSRRLVAVTSHPLTHTT